MLQPIVTFPDQRLRIAASPVTSFDAALRTLTTDLLDTLRAAPGVGITAPHIGIAQRVVVLDLPGVGPEIFINPVIEWASDDRLRHEEGSISMPGVVETVERAAAVRVAYRDLDGNEHTVQAEGLAAVCHQHEIDQLDGIFWIQRLSPLRRTRLVARFEKAQRAASRSGSRS